MPTGKLTKESAYHEGMLQYFNEALLERKVINEADYRAMQIKIRSAYTPSVKKKNRTEVHSDDVPRSFLYFL